MCRFVLHTGSLKQLTVEGRLNLRLRLTLLTSSFQKSSNLPVCVIKYIRKKNRKGNRQYEGEFLPVPEVKKGKWSKERERTKFGRWRKKRSDADQPRKRKRSTVKYALAIIGAIALVLLVIYFFFPRLLGLA